MKSEYPDDFEYLDPDEIWEALREEVQLEIYQKNCV